MAVVDDTRVLAQRIIEVVRNENAPLYPRDIEDRLAAMHVEPSQTQLRDTIWALIHMGNLILLPDRRVQAN